MSPRETSGPCV